MDCAALDFWLIFANIQPMPSERNQIGGRKRNLSERATENTKRHVFRIAKWVALGASLLFPGCSESGEKDQERPEQTEVFKRFDFENSFPIDQAQMNPTVREQVKAQVEQFLDEHNTRATFHQLKQSRITIEVSSDERLTQAWGERGNEALSEARLKELDRLLREIITSYDFVNEISSQHVDVFKRKTFTKRMPGGEWGRGVTPLTRIENPLTGALYTQAELKQLSHSARENLFDQARYAEVVFELPGKNEIDNQYDKLVEIMAGYDNVTFLVDRSGSMRDDYQRLGHSFSAAFGRREGDFVSDTTYVVPFESNADLNHYRSIPPQEIEQYLLNLQLYGGTERLFNALSAVFNKKIQTPEAAKRRAMIVLTDEGIQDFSAGKLREFIAGGKEHQIDVYFALIAKNGLITFTDLPGLLYEYDQFVTMYNGRNTKNMSPEEKASYFDGKIRYVQVDDDGNLIFLAMYRGW